MTKVAYDVDGYMGEATTAAGWFLFGAWCRKQIPIAVREFGQTGYSEQPGALAEALAMLKCRTNANNHIRRRIIVLAKRARMVLIVSD